MARKLVLGDLEELVASLDGLLGLDLVAAREQRDGQEEKGGCGRTLPMAWHASLSLLAHSLFHPGSNPARLGVPNSVEFPRTKQQSFFWVRRNPTAGAAENGVRFAGLAPSPPGTARRRGIMSSAPALCAGRRIV